MSVSVALSSVALMQSSIAQQQARQAEINSCQSLIPQFESMTTERTEQMRQAYAHCVSLLAPATHSDILIGKWIVGTILLTLSIGFIVGLIWPIDGFALDWGDRFMSAAIRAFAALLGVAVLAMLLVGIVFVFS